MKLMPSTNLFYDIFNEAFDLPVLNNTIMKTDITDTNGNGDYSREFNYNSTSYINNHLLDIIYSANTAEYGEYLITVQYTDADGNIVCDSLIYTLNKAYFKFELRFYERRKLVV